MTLGDNFPQLPVPSNSRRVCLGFRDLETRTNHHRVCQIHNGENEPLEDIAERFVLSAKLLAGLSLKQIREAFSGSNVRIYWDMEE